MTNAPKSRFVYVSFIRATREQLWSALTDPEMMKQYWFGCHQDSDFKPGSPWRLLFSDGRVADSGEVLEADPPRRLVLKWRNEWNPELTAEGHAICTMELEQAGKAVKLTITHEIDRAESQYIQAVSGGWPRVISNLKSLLETGKVLMESK